MRILTLLMAVAALCSFAHGADSSMVARAHADKGGLVHIVRTDGKDVQVHAEKGQVGVDSIQVAPDKATVGWLVSKQAPCCVSYPLPMELVVWRAGKVVRRIDTGRPAWSWIFLDGGRKVAYRASFPHGGWSGESVLVDVATGKTLGSWDHPVDANGNDTDDNTGEPDWAKQIP